MATGQVRIAGVDVRTIGAGAEVRIVPSRLSISTKGPTQVAVKGLVLYRGAIDWKVGETFQFPVERGVQLRGLPATGSASFTVDAGSRSVLIGLNLQLPSVLGGVTAATTLRAGSSGVAIDDVEVAAGSARIGRFELRDLSLSYAEVGGSPHFEGQGTLVLPSLPP